MKKILLLAVMLTALITTTEAKEIKKAPAPVAQTQKTIVTVELEKGSAVPIPAGGKSEFLQMNGRPCTKVTEANGNITFYFIKK